MLTLKVRPGDDVWIGHADQALDQYRQVIVHRVNGQFMTVLTPDEEIDIPFGDDLIDLGLEGVRVCTKANEMVPDQYVLGISAPRHVLVLTGRNYRKSLDG